MAVVGIPCGSITPASAPKARALTRSVSQDLPEDEAIAMRGAGQPESREGCCHADGDVAPSGGQGEERGQNLIGAEDEEDKAGDAHALHQCEGARAQR